MDKILKQTSWLFGAQLFGKVIGFFYTIFLARNLGVEDFGLYSVALVYFSLASTISDFGFNRFLTREISKESGNLADLLSNVTIFRATLTTVCFAFFAIFLYLFDPDKLRVNLILLAVMAVIPQSVAMSIDSVFVALQKLQFSSIALLVLNVSTTIFGILLVNFGFSATGTIDALIFGQFIYLLTLIIFLKKQKIKYLGHIEFKALIKIIKGSLPYGILSILGLLYFRVDLLMLTYIKGNFDAGIYGAAYKFLEAIVFIPSALATALFPILTKFHETDPGKIKKLYFSSIKIMGFAGIGIALSYFLILPLIIKAFLPNYLLSIEVIKILALTIPFMFIHVPGAQVLLSTDKYLKPVFYLSIVTLSFNILLNLIFIPHFGVLAAAWVTVLSEILSFLVFFNLLKRKVL